MFHTRAKKLRKYDWRVLRVWHTREETMRVMPRVMRNMYIPNN